MYLYTSIKHIYIYAPLSTLPLPFLPSSFLASSLSAPTLCYIYTELEKEKQVTVLIMNGISCGKVRIEIF
jgi:hypothetical protein